MMDSQTTVGLARLDFGAQFPSVPGQHPDYFLQALNRVSRRIIDSGTYKGNTMTLFFQPQLTQLGLLGNGTDGYITLPRRYNSCLSMRFGCVPAPIFSQWHEYVQAGPGELDAKRPTIGILVDAGDGWPSQKIVPPNLNATIQIGITNVADAGKTVRVFGLDENACPIFDSFGEGFNITTGFPFSVPNGQVVTMLQKLQGPIQGQPLFVGNWSCWYVAPGAMAVQIGQYEPTEQFPNYHRYLCQNLRQTFPSGDTLPIAISVLARRRWVRLVAETDFMVPDDPNVIGYGLRAVNHENAKNYTMAEAEWAMAERVLDAATTSLRAGARMDADLANEDNEGFGWGENGGYGSWGWWGGNPQNAI
jgi:hypothetical protein